MRTHTLRRRLARGLAAALLLAPAVAPGAEDGTPGAAASAASPTSPTSPGWGLDLALHYGYFDRDGSLETRAPGAGAASDGLQLDGTLAGLQGRLRLPAEALGAQPFLQLSGDFDASDAQDRGGLLLAPGGSASFLSLSEQASLAVDAGLEWQTAPLLAGRPLRLRPYAGLGLTFWDGHLERAAGASVDRDNEDFSTLDARLGAELGLPLARGEGAALDWVLGTRAELPFGDAGETFETTAGSARGELELEEAWAAYTGLELRFGAAL